jgi:hypothetical protein
MGVDIVEFIMAVEEEFEVRIPDREAGRIRTAGQMCEYLRQKRSDNDVWERLCKLIAAHFRVDPPMVTPEFDFLHGRAPG